MIKRITTILELYNALQKFEGTETAFHNWCLDMLMSNRMDRSVYLEFLEIIGADMMECMDEAMND